MVELDEIINIASKRGFFFATAEIYGSKAGFWTYGHLGVLMKRKFESLWRDYFLSLDSNFLEIEGSSILPRKVFEGSGHLSNFKDPMVECLKCRTRYRADSLIEDKTKKTVTDIKDMQIIVSREKLKCPKCGGEFGEVKFFNMMFDVKIGALAEEEAYLSPETAQNPFLSFKREFFALREKLPLGLAMIGKAYRNEISPRQGFFRLREFTQAELQIFLDPKDIDKYEGWSKIKKNKVSAVLSKKEKTSEVSLEELNIKHKIPKYYLFLLDRINDFYISRLKIPKQKLRFRQLGEDERAFYNKIHFDLELDLTSLGGFKEVAGLHYRGEHDLLGHQKHSGMNLGVVSDGKKILPHVIEVSFGVDRNIFSLLDIFYKTDKERVLFTFPSNLAPFEVAVFPLVNKDGLYEKAKDVFGLVSKHYKTLLDFSGSIGRMYRRVDEIGVPAMITIDYDTLKDNTVTLRERDSMNQIRVNTSELVKTIEKFLSGQKLERLGKVI